MQSVTAVILTYNEERNISQCLGSLKWCDRIVIVDSGSSDRTKEKALSFAKVSWFSRPFDTHAQQWRFALFQTGIRTELVLALDSDMVVTESFVRELTSSFDKCHAGGVVPFKYCSLGQQLKGSLYPAQLRLMRLSNASVLQRGHTQEFEVTGSVYRFNSFLVHDDRKAIGTWLNAQVRYSDLEVCLINADRKVSLKSALRRMGIMPFIAGALAYMRAGGPLSGRAALNYGYERMTYELMLALRIFRSVTEQK